MLFFLLRKESAFTPHSHFSACVRSTHINDPFHINSGRRTNCHIRFFNVYKRLKLRKIILGENNRDEL